MAPAQASRPAFSRDTEGALLETGPASEEVGEDGRKDPEQPRMEAERYARRNSIPVER